MKILKLAALFLSVNAASYAQGEAKRFAVSPEAPKSGEEITITYDPAGTILKDAKEVSGRMYTHGSFKWKVSDVTLKQTADKKWQTKIKLADDAALINFVFVSDTLLDRGGKETYSWMIPPTKSSYSGWGLMRNESFADQHPNVLDPVSSINDTISLMWINYEMQYHPESRKDIFYEGLRLMKSAKPGDPTKRIKSELRFILADNLDNEHQYKMQKALDLLEQPANKAFTDSVQQVLLTKYPNGVLARDLEIKKIFNEADFNKKVALYNAFEKNFPQSKFEDVLTDTESLFYDKMVKGIMYNYIVKNKDYSFTLNSVKNVSYFMLVDYAWHLISIPFDRDQEGSEKASLETLKKYADIIIPELESREAFLPKQYVGKLSPKEWQAQALQNAAREYFTYAKLLEVLKQYDLSKKYLEKIKPIMKFDDASYNEVYSRMLLREGRVAEANAYLITAAKSNKITPTSITALKDLYVKAGKKEADFEAYFHSLKAETNDEHKKKLISELINLPIDGFEMESNRGGKVKLADQKGKIVVLDFWAMWCGPCKNAMPGMNMAVNKYKADDNVKFYFVDTMEYIKDFKAQTQAFIKEKGFDFTILYDSKNPKTGKYDAVYDKYSKAFHFSGIPEKMIIDQNGKLRWMSNGYFGSPSELADEISIIVEYLKTEKK
ncbi:TlpA disulfide reductase family protein [Flavobacterium foetidum]|uniref:TlpA disulfide reductase family protein n=1 Tax=Flavobacterium foetidum TaxID=2026681 RepID=UPI0010757D44|nr:TlpA disulfide reductase family protein [Flavobacterium foetidum]KAF2516690.1 redoxin domain-containing protein [Flavobacterium foetidum]